MFDDILGNDSAKVLLERLVSRDRLPQSLLFTGRSGIGKKLFAIEIARALVCTDPETDLPCRNCAACTRASSFNLPKADKRDEHQKVAFSGHPDVGMLVPYNNTILIDAVRDLEREANFRPFEARARLFIIDEAEKLSSVKDNAANALLKTLEEPSETTHIILITSRPLLLLSTIRSRCQAVRFGPIAKEQIVGHLTNELKYASEDAALVAGLSQGSLGRALGTDLGKFRDLRKQMLDVVTRCCRRDNYAALMRTSEEMTDAKAKDSYSESLDILQTLIHDIWSIGKRGNASIVNFDLRPELEWLAEASDPERLTLWLEEIETLRENLNFNLNRKLATDALFMTMAGSSGTPASRGQ
ncbi:MAG TPA: DNA polymerase III subunit delta' C-terminal domain-containing protein [Aridibacter sp.]|nr:DNA polymerase III subunit delta' C-terminal domain-containing protein [Aridibacter sp.]